MHLSFSQDLVNMYFKLTLSATHVFIPPLKAVGSGPTLSIH